jgi:hypothetical protein
VADHHEPDETVVGIAIDGDKLTRSPYRVWVDQDKVVEAACMKEYNAADIENMKFFIDHSYHYKLYLDMLPSASIIRNSKG